ncbi:hypothetical protein L1987_16353 [Smallanthus sonchifolius]|uniref:Uncharacterized protein n=1 Tax=Smallanthus sonchifolius TaxID=185202 RepID=A0ACB9JAS1_9ASTR|nr:hypothetical protein L1987_16353 [Smallanthus sonchifolius]
MCTILDFRDALMKNVKDECSFENLLEVEGWNLFKLYSDGAAFVELLGLLESSPHLAIKVFNWRRKKDQMRPMSPEEYAKGIKLVGRIKDVDLAVEIFMEATSRRIKNHLDLRHSYGAYMCNGQLLIDQMETVFQEMKDYIIAPDITTYNNMIAGYITAWMWDSMEDTYRNLEKMEQIYNIVGPHVREKNITLIRAMICAYCKFPYRNRVKRIKELMRLIPENEYRPWLNVLLIRVYAEEDLVDQMDKSIDEAFEHNTSVNTVRIMRTITSTYIRHNAVDKLAKFLTRAGDSGWRMCRGLYHELMWVFATHKRLEEMEEVLVEMERLNHGCSKRTFLILLRRIRNTKNEIDINFTGC